jgi:hypothetical protein
MMRLLLPLQLAHCPCLICTLLSLSLLLLESVSLHVPCPFEFSVDVPLTLRPFPPTLKLLLAL